MEDYPESARIFWINLRRGFSMTNVVTWGLIICISSEEPIVYINGSPYCLRRENFSLRNMKVNAFILVIICFFLLLRRVLK